MPNSVQSSKLSSESSLTLLIIGLSRDASNLTSSAFIAAF